MDYKNKIIPLFETVKGIAEKHSVSKDIIAANRTLQNETQNFKVFIPLLGTFNAGKSSLLNALLGKEILPQNIVPETTIACELHYGPEEKLVAYKKSGEPEVFQLEDISKIIPSQYTHIELYQNNEILKELNNIVIVDMPGLDSAIAEHNQAIVNYIKQGVYYIVLAEVEFGLKESVLNFLYELNAYEIDFSILVSKIDHKLPEDVELVQQNVKAVAKNITGKDVTVGKVSTKLNEITDFISLLKNVDQTNLIVANLQPKIIQSIDQVSKDLDIRLKHYSIDTVEIDQKIRDLERGIVEIEREIDFQSQQIDRKFDGETVEKILNDVNQVLHENMSSLVRAAKSGGENLNREINNLIRPTLINSVDYNISEVFSHSFVDINSKMDKLGNSLALVTSSLKEGTEKVTNVLDIISDPKFRTVVGGLALATSVVAPWIELVIFFLPEIIKLFSNQDQHIQQQIETQVIPEITSKLRPEIKQNLFLIKEQFIQEMRNDVERNKSELIASLQQAKVDKQSIQEQGQQVIGEIKSSLAELQSMKQNVLKEREVVEYLG
ncbi:dynamin family protein [Neobacillus niacini]|uniref:dynamin family protein n=1 Tax=Neobacillus niacini TaxID=86668 RepID=UPI002FFDAE7C